MPAASLRKSQKQSLFAETMSARQMRKKAAAKQIAADLRASQKSNVLMQKATGTIADHHVRELVRNSAYRCAGNNANAEVLPDLGALKDTNAC